MLVLTAPLLGCGQQSWFSEAQTTAPCTRQALPRPSTSSSRPAPRAAHGPAPSQAGVLSGGTAAPGRAPSINVTPLVSGEQSEQHPNLPQAPCHPAGGSV